jgi:dTDP-4-dehydrorhamnose 3,5-epimerase
MKILSLTSLAIPEVKVIRFARLPDHRGYFAEHYRKSDIENGDQTAFLRGIEFLQCNESFSKSETLRGLHYQWNPYMGKLVRTVHGHMVDLALDIRKDSPTFGKIVAHDMPSDPSLPFDEWIWVPVGFAHGNFFMAETTIEYFCSGEYSPTCEAGISPLARDIDWSLCDQGLKKRFDGVVGGNVLISNKDRNGYSLSSWLADGRSNLFVYPMP